MKVNISIWDRLSKVIVFLLFVAGFLGVFYWYLPLIKQNQRYRENILNWETKIQKQDHLERHLKRLIYDVQNDPATVERIARERLGYAKPNETIIKFD